MEGPHVPVAVAGEPSVRIAQDQRRRDQSDPGGDGLLPGRQLIGDAEEDRRATEWDPATTRPTTTPVKAARASRRDTRRPARTAGGRRTSRRSTEPAPSRANRVVRYLTRASVSSQGGAGDMTDVDLVRLAERGPSRRGPSSSPPKSSATRWRPSASRWPSTSPARRPPRFNQSNERNATVLDAQGRLAACRWASPSSCSRAPCRCASPSTSSAPRSSGRATSSWPTTLPRRRPPPRLQRLRPRLRHPGRRHPPHGPDLLHPVPPRRHRRLGPPGAATSPPPTSGAKAPAGR